MARRIRANFAGRCQCGCGQDFEKGTLIRSLWIKAGHTPEMRRKPQDEPQPAPTPRTVTVAARVVETTEENTGTALARRPVPEPCDNAIVAGPARQAAGEGVSRRTSPAPGETWVIDGDGFHPLDEKPKDPEPGLDFGGFDV